MPILVAAALTAGLVGHGIGGQASAAWPGTNGKIFFASARDGNLEIYSMNPDGSSQTRLTRTTGDEFSPSVSANGRWVTFGYLPDPAAEPGQRVRIELMREDGSDRRTVTGSTTEADFSPTFSPTGSTLLISRETDPANENSRLWTIGVDGRNASQLIAPSPFFELEGEYFPTGDRIAYVQDVPVGEPRIYTVNSDGTDPNPVSPEGRGASSGPSTSPDGLEIAWWGYQTRDDLDSLIAVTEVSTGATRTVVPAAATVFVDQPAWSPEGDALVLARYDGNRPDTETQIVRVSPEGGQLTDLTGPSTTANFEPFWAPEPTDPALTVVRKPARSTKKRAATFRFRATPGTTLRCKLDRRKPRTCPTDRRVTFRKLRRGKHQLRVTPVATDPTAQALGLPSQLRGQAQTIRWRVR